MSTAVLTNIRIVLVDTNHPGNIGGAARAMKNMGITQLHLVSPKQFPDPQARARAASALDILQQAVVHDSLENAISGCGLVIGTSARERRIPWPLLDSRSAAEQVVAELFKEKACSGDAAQPIAILFGREDRGLTNDELQRCNFHMTIPTDAYSSLNLAAAVQVFCYELRMAALSDYTVEVEWDKPPASNDDLERYYEHLENVLVDINFIDPKAPRQTMTRLRRFYNRLRPDEMELAMLRGILTYIERIITK
ncbi:MAG: RNA methyltransferase [Pseudomonadota bacterium]